jgi:hypothetical protein
MAQHANRKGGEPYGSHFVLNTKPKQVTTRSFTKRGLTAHTEPVLENAPACTRRSFSVQLRYVLIDGI